MKVEVFDPEEDSTIGLIFKNTKIDYECFTCDGSGKVRDNISKEGTYTFRKTICPNCKGTGQRKAKL
jgi:DnaJ-class molecular chaperone